MSANNSLGQSRFDTDDINEMLQAAKKQSFNNGRLIVYHHAYGSNAPELKEVTSQGVNTLKIYDRKESSADSARMATVIADMRSLAPAQSYGLVLWSHGSGWIQDGRSGGVIPAQANVPVLYSFGQDILPNRESRWMNVTTLKKVLEGKNFDFIYFDCCYMAGIEVLYELRHVTRHIVASATVLMEEGMPYQQNLELLFAPQPDLIGAARNTFNYYNSRTDYTRSCTISVTDCSYLDEIAEFTRNAYESGHPMTVDAELQKYTIDTPCYYYDFMDYVKAVSGNSSSYINLMNSMNDAILYKAHTPSLWGSLLDIKRHSGLSTYILRNADDAKTLGYEELAWWQDVVHGTPVVPMN